MADPLFAASYMKLARAEKFIQELEAELKRYSDSKPLSAHLEHASNPPALRVDWVGIGLAPGAIIGDAIHNLRTALDLMASELARINGRSDRGVYFPFSDTKESFKDAIRSKNFHKAGQDAVALIESFGPYRNGNELLRALHDLDVQDKHTALVPTGHTMDIEVNAAYNIDDLAQNAVTVAGKDIHYVFPEDGILGGRKIVETLKQLVELVKGILETFSRMVEARTTPAP